MDAAQRGEKAESISDDDLWQCTTCYTCVEWCPRKVEVVDVITALRNIAVANGKMHENHRKIAESLIRLGHTIESNDKIKELRKRLGLPADPPTVLSSKAAKADLDKILEITGFKRLVEQ
jgi:heterodisulfide reductase subunit C